MKEKKQYLMDFLQLRLCRQAYDVSRHHDLDHLKHYCLQKGDRAELVKGMMQWGLLCSSKHNDNLPPMLLMHALSWFKAIHDFLPGQYPLHAMVAAVKKLLVGFKCNAQSFYHFDFEHQRLSAPIPCDTSQEGHNQVLLNTNAALTRCGEYSMSVFNDAAHLPIVIGIGDKPWVSDFTFDDAKAATLVQSNLDAARRVFIEGLWEGLISEDICDALLSAAISNEPFFHLSKLSWYPGCHEKILSIVPQALWSTKRTAASIEVKTWHRLLALMAAEEKFFPVKKNNLDKTWRHVGTMRPPEESLTEKMPKNQHFHVYIHRKKAVSNLSDLLNPETVQHIYLESGVCNFLNPDISGTTSNTPQLVAGRSKVFTQQAVLTDKTVKESA